jgi:protein-S-isoprenylcysteine O-methyltransferase Ste14
MSISPRKLPADGKPSGPIHCPRFRLAPTFIIELAFSVSYLMLLSNLLKRAQHFALALFGVATITVLIMLCYVGKFAIIRFLERRGGDARTYVESQALVTEGPYSWSRNPTYLFSCIQFLLWSGLFIFLQLLEPVQPGVLTMAMFAPVLFFVVTDRIVIPHEERALKSAHPLAFAEYSEKVGRWFGRRS